jgi:hypothetical protein
MRRLRLIDRNHSAVAVAIRVVVGSRLVRQRTVGNIRHCEGDTVDCDTSARLCHRTLPTDIGDTRTGAGSAIAPGTTDGHSSYGIVVVIVDGEGDGGIPAARGARDRQTIEITHVHIAAWGRGGGWATAGTVTGFQVGGWIIGEASFGDIGDTEGPIGTILLDGRRKGDLARSIGHAAGGAAGVTCEGAADSGRAGRLVVLVMDADERLSVEPIVAIRDDGHVDAGDV